MAMIANLVRQSTTTGGTGNKVLAPATAGYRNFSDVFGTGSGNPFFAVQRDNLGNVEAGRYYMSNSTTLVPVSVLYSSNGNAAVDFPAGVTVTVYSDLPAERAIYSDGTQLRGAPDGAAATPAWTFESDLDTGFYRPTADTLAAATGGVNRWTLDSTGLTLTGPAVTLSTTSDAISVVKSTGTIQSAVLSLTGRQSSSDNTWHVIASGSGLASARLRFSAGANWATASEVLSLTTTGAAVTGTLSATGSVTLGDASTDTHTLNGMLTAATGGAIALDDSVTSASTTPLPLHFDGDTNTGMLRTFADTLAIVTGGAAAIQFSSNQNVSIGTTNNVLARLLVNNAGALTTLMALTSNTGVAAIYGSGESESYATAVIQSACHRAASSAYSFYNATSDSNGTPDTEFVLRGDGEAFADGSWTGGGADYAEYFEWADGNPDAEDRRGLSVALDGNQIKVAGPADEPIGVISGNPSVVGDAAWNHWTGKFQRDDFGSYVMEDYEAVAWTETVPAVTETVQEQASETRERIEPVIEMRDGVPVRVMRTVPYAAPLFDHVAVVDEDGQPVLELVREAVLDEAGEEVAPAEYRPLTHPVPVMIEVERETEPARTVEHSYAADAVPEGVTVPADAVRTLQQRRVLNPDWDPAQGYVSREDRPEWSVVGLMGKLRVRKGQVVGGRWIKMRDVSADVEEWLVR